MTLSLTTVCGGVRRGQGSLSTGGEHWMFMVVRAEIPIAVPMPFVIFKKRLEIENLVLTHLLGLSIKRDAALAAL